MKYNHFTRGTSPTLGRIGRRLEGDPTCGRAGTESDPEYTLLYFIYVIPTWKNSCFDVKCARSWTNLVPSNKKSYNSNVLTSESGIRIFNGATLVLLEIVWFIRMESVWYNVEPVPYGKLSPGPEHPYRTFSRHRYDIKTFIELTAMNCWVPAVGVTGNSHFPLIYPTVKEEGTKAEVWNIAICAI